MKFETCGYPLIVFAVLIFGGCATSNVRVSDPTDIRGYVASANEVKPDAATETGSLWANQAYRSNLFRDMKARHVNDVVTIRVYETTQAVASADAMNSRETSAAAGFDHLFGAEKLVSELPNLVGGESSSSFEGSGSTSRATTLQTNLTARVVDVLPNGYLVVEGMREISVNNESQSVYLTGVVRPQDIDSNNTVFSSAVAQMKVSVKGQGVVSQPIKPGWLFRILNGIMPF
jgi:flagellar L-ring protein precursor FlgH